MSKNILVISHDKVGPSMAGPGIRYHKIATHLSKKHEVTLAVFNPSYIANIGKTSYKAIDIHAQRFKEEFAKYDVIIALWLSDEMIEFAKSKNIVLIFDLYAPVPVEDLVQRVFGGNVSKESDYDYDQMLSNYGHFIKNGDFLLTSNEQQRDFWIGYAFSIGKINPSRQVKRPIDSYFGICPIGIDMTEIDNLSKKDLLTKRIPDIKQKDFVIVWTGGIWDWFDAITPLRAMLDITKKGRVDIKLVFLGTKHPNDDVPAMAETEKARVFATEHNLINKSVYFLDGWLPYTDRIYYLKRANLALYAHKPSVESRFSHRTRMLDHILMALPTIATKGDYFSDYIDEHDLGISVEPFDHKAMANAITTIHDNTKRYESIKRNIIVKQPSFTWDYTLAELDAFIESRFFKPSLYEKRLSSNAIGYFKNSQIASKVKQALPRHVKTILKRIISQ